MVAVAPVSPSRLRLGTGTEQQSVDMGTSAPDVFTALLQQWQVFRRRTRQPQLALAEGVLLSHSRWEHRNVCAITTK